MAYTIERTPVVHGSQRGTQMKITADAATQSIDTGIDYIMHMQVTPVSAATVVGNTFKPNLDASGAAANGFLGVSGLASGDEFFVVVYGR